ncbi:glycosyltransferase [Salinicoccus bachuensis]|uniref:Glycosyltransferase n=1 Tax=Salinicoccus bachuensis TaxID=3136731 RepID=A0ABZ3CJK0_9STAP
MLAEDKKLAIHILEKELSRSEATTVYSTEEKASVAGKPHFLDEIIDDLEKIEGKTASYLYRKFDVKVGIVCDEFIYHAYKDTCDLVYIDSSFNGMDKDLDALIVVSTWKGIDQSWKNVGNPKSTKRQELYKLMEQAGSMDIPVVFYSKEDPVNYDRYIDVAMKADVIFTSAVEMVTQYKKECENDRVYSIGFGINPFYHNPDGRHIDNNDEVIFAGSWNERYPERNEEISHIFDGVLEAGKDLTIIDRNLPMQNDRYHFPLKYGSHITHPVQHNNLMKVHKLFNWNININTIKYSETMFANRVYELQALGALMMTNYSSGINNEFPYINIVNDKSDINNILTRVSALDMEEIRMKAISTVMLNHTTFHRLKELLSPVGITLDMKNPRVLVLNRYGEEYRRMFDRQTFQKFDAVSELPEDVHEYDFIFEVHSGNYYEENFLESLVGTFSYKDVDFVTMDSDNTFRKTSRPVPGLTMYKAGAVKKEEAVGYSIPRVEVKSVAGKAAQNGTEKKLSVIIPIHNNGKYLEYKCFNSLKRQSMFNQMEIIFVDDGSTDVNTINTIERLRRRYPDIKYHRFEEGSGSASRPRNKGVDLVTTEYVTYLDPDNEAIGDGYSELLNELLKDPELDMSVGNIIREDSIKRVELKYSGAVYKFNNGSNIIDNPAQFLKDSALKTQSIQALIARTSIVRHNGLKMVEGAAGQDTIFFQELMLHSNKVKVIPTFIHIYYAFVSGSVTNTISKKFFDKYYTLEQYRIPFLKEHDLFETYVNERFDFYFRNWYLKRVPRLKAEERIPALKTLLHIYDLYVQEGVKGSAETREAIKSIQKEVAK